MKVDITKPEEMFAALNVGTSTFVFNQFQEYESKQEVLIEEIKKLQNANKELEHTIKTLKIKYGEVKEDEDKE